MLSPFMLPEGLIIPLVVGPILVHICHQIIVTKRLEDLSDVGVSTAAIAVGIVST